VGFHRRLYVNFALNTMVGFSCLKHKARLSLSHIYCSSIAAQRTDFINSVNVNFGSQHLLTGFSVITHIYLYAFYCSCKGCPTRYRTLHFFNNSNTNKYVATKFEQEYVRCVRNEEKCVCSACL
jgi:hypothetical protein